MDVQEFSEEIREKIRAVFNDTDACVSDTKRILKEIIVELDDISGDAEIMIDSLPD